MKKILTMVVCVVMLAACESRRTDEGSTAREPDRTTNERDRTDNTDRDNERSSPVVGTRDRDKDRENDKDGLFDRDKEAEERIDASVASAGRTIFRSECANCHRVVDKNKDGVDNDADRKYAGPELTEITDRRNDRWLVKFMTNTDGRDRTDNDPEDVCMVQRKGKELNRDQALKVLEYLHQRNVRDDESQ